MFGLSKKEKRKKAEAAAIVAANLVKFEQDGLGDETYVKLRVAASLKASPDNLISAKLPRNGVNYTILVGYPDEDTPIGAMYSPEGRFIPVFQFDINIKETTTKKFHILTAPYGPDEYCEGYDIFLTEATAKIANWSRFVR